MVGGVLIYVLLIGFMILLFVLPTIMQKKRMKEFNSMLDNLSVGDEVRTVGGIIGKIVKIADKETGKVVTIETGIKGKKTTVELDAAGIGLVLKSVNAPKEATTTEVAENKDENLEIISADEVKDNVISKEVSADDKIEDIEEQISKKSKKNKK